MPGPAPAARVAAAFGVLAALAPVSYTAAAGEGHSHWGLTPPSCQTAALTRVHFELAVCTSGRDPMRLHWSHGAEALWLARARLLWLNH